MLNETAAPLPDTMQLANIMILIQYLDVLYPNACVPEVRKASDLDLNSSPWGDALMTDREFTLPKVKDIFRLMSSEEKKVVAEEETSFLLYSERCFQTWLKLRMAGHVYTGTEYWKSKQLAFA